VLVGVLVSLTSLPLSSRLRWDFQAVIGKRPFRMRILPGVIHRVRNDAAGGVVSCQDKRACENPTGLTLLHLAVSFIVSQQAALSFHWPRARWHKAISHSITEPSCSYPGWATISDFALLYSSIARSGRDLVTCNLPFPKRKNMPLKHISIPSERSTAFRAHCLGTAVDSIPRYSRPLAHQRPPE
jgi:hypothetical protein